MALGEVGGGKPVLGRMHSECLTGDVLFCQRCDCGAQLEGATAQHRRRRPRRAALPAPGRPRDRPDQQGARLPRCRMPAQTPWRPTMQLGFQADQRSYSHCKPMLEKLGIVSRADDNDPRKIDAGHAIRRRRRRAGFTSSSTATRSTAAIPANQGVQARTPDTRRGCLTSMNNLRHELSMTVLMTPDMANFSGNVHGGAILKYLDSVAYACASRYSGSYVVTLSVDRVMFRQPIHVGELVTFLASVKRRDDYAGGVDGTRARSAAARQAGELAPPSPASLSQSLSPQSAPRPPRLWVFQIDSAISASSAVRGS